MNFLETEVIRFLGENLQLRQPLKGYRPGLDAVLLSAFAPIQKDEILLDAGTGVGTLLLCLNHFHPQKIKQGVGLEVQCLMAQLAAENFRLNLTPHLSVFQGSMGALPLKGQLFSHIVTNPPYGDGKAQTRSEDMQKSLSHQGIIHDLPFSTWVEQLVKLLKPKGRISMIAPVYRLEDVLKGLEGLSIKILPVAPAPRKAHHRLLVTAQKDYKAPLQLLPTFETRDANGEVTLKMKRLSLGKETL